MKIIIKLKDPDGVYESIQQIADQEVEKLVEASNGLLKAGDVEDTVGEKIREMTRSFVEYGEYVTIEIDTDTNTARVLKRGEAEF